MNAARSLSMRSSITEKHDAAVAIGDSKTEKLYEDGGKLDGPKRKRFFCWLLTKKQWLAAVIGSALVVILVILLIIFLAIVPAIFQNQVDKVHLTLNHLDIKSITTEGSTNKMNIELSVRLDAAGVSASSTIDEASVKLYFQDKAFMAVPLPEQHLKSGDNSFDIVVSDQVEVTDAETFRALSKRVITEKETLVDARTRLKVHAKGLSYGDLKLERTLTVKGIQQFNDPKPVFNNINLAECSDKAYKLIINVTLDNEAGVGIGGIGALNLSVYNPVGYLGQAITHDTKGIPRGPKETMLDLTVAKDPKILPAFASLVSGFLAMNAPLFANGDHPYAMSAPLLNDAFAVLNVSLSYVDGLKKLTINPDCDVGAIVAAATTASNTTKA